MIKISISKKDYKYIEDLEEKIILYLKNLGITFCSVGNLYEMRVNNTQRVDLWSMEGIRRCIQLYTGKNLNSYLSISTKANFVTGVNLDANHMYFKVAFSNNSNEVVRFVESLEFLSQYEYANSDILHIFFTSEKGRKFTFFSFKDATLSLSKVCVADLVGDIILVLESNNSILLEILGGIIYANCVDLCIPITNLDVSKDPRCLELRNKWVVLTTSYIYNFVGEFYERYRIETQLLRAGYNVKHSTNKNNICVGLPIYRKNLSRNEIVSDLFLEPEFIPKVISPINFNFYKSDTDPWIDFINGVKRFIINQGFQERINQLLSDTRESDFRISLLQQLMKTEYTLQRKPLPHSFFEIGPVAVVTKEDLKFEDHLAVLYFNAKVNINSFGELVNLLSNVLHRKVKLKNSKGVPFFIEGRSVELYLDHKCVGFMGEFHPKYLYENRIKSPGIYLEVSLSSIYNILREEFFTIRGGNQLKGAISVSGSKNAALPIIFTAAALPIKSILKNVPTGLQDVQTALNLLSKLGVYIKVNEEEKIVEIKGPITSNNFIYEDIGLIRYSLLLMAVGISQFNTIRFPTKVGGCNIGDRKYDQHLLAFQQLGVTVSYEKGIIKLEREKIGGKIITFSLQSTGATENALILAMFAESAVTFNNAHLRPEILDQINFMCKAGMNIEVDSKNNLIHIQPMKEFGKTAIEYNVMGDLDEAVTFIVATQITGGNISISGFNPKYIKEELGLLRKLRLNIIVGKNNVVCKAVAPRTLLPFSVEVGAYPAIGSDRNPILAVLASSITGTSYIKDNRFPERTKYIEQVIKLGMQVEHKNAVTEIKGSFKCPNQNQELIVSDIRGGIACLILALTSNSSTKITNVFQIDRGMEEVEKKLSSLGAQITRSSYTALLL